MTDSSGKNQQRQSSRRDFLTKTAAVAAAASLVQATGCASMRGPKIAVAAGRKPKSITADSTIGIGLIGIGGRGRSLLTQALKQKNISIKVLADPTPDNQKQVLEMVAKATGEKPDVYGGREDWKKVLERDDVDAIISATPCYMHGRIYLGCFAAGKHFYGEKPMVIEANEADALVEAQKKNPEIKAQIGFQRRASQCYAEGVKQISDGVIGDPIAGYAAWNLKWGPLGIPNPGQDPSEAGVWFGRRKYSGDWMLEQACHTWDVFGWVTGKLPVAASGAGRRDIFKDEDPARDVTDFYNAHIKYENGLIIDFEHNWFTPHADNKAKFSGVFERLVGRKGGIALTEGTFYPRDAKAGGPVVYKKEEGGHQIYTAWSIQAFFNSLRTQTPAISGVENGRMATYVGLLVRKAVDEQRWVKMDELL